MEPSSKDDVTEKMDKLKVEENKDEEEKIDENDRQAHGEVEVAEGVQEFHRNQESRFLSSSIDWNDEKLGIPEKIKQALRDAEVLRPSKIQAYAIPIVRAEPKKSVVAQSHNGSGKTFAFALWALVSIEPKVKGVQVLVFAHTRELVNQIYSQIQVLNKYTEYDVAEVKKEDKSPHIGQITVITPGKCNTLFKFKKLDFSHLKMVVVDEADHFFGNEADRDITTRLIAQIDEKKEGVQKLFFSATYNEEVTAAIKKIIPDNSVSIRLKNKLLTLKGVKQMYYVSKERSKFEIIEDLFNEFDNTQMIIFVNTKKFAEMAHFHLTKKGYKASIITGNVDPEERDKIMVKFRNRELQFLFATNVLSRGIDISDMKLMINLDIPTVLDSDGFLNADCENYLHRIGRTGRFDTKGLALTIIDGKEERFDKEMECLKQIQDTYESEISELKSIEDLPDIYKEHCEH